MLPTFLPVKGGASTKRGEVDELLGGNLGLIKWAEKWVQSPPSLFSRLYEPNLAFTTI